MQVFLIGGLTGNRGDSHDGQEAVRLREYGSALGSALVTAGHTMLICSPFPGSLDHEAVVGASATVSDDRLVNVEIHHLNTPSVVAAVGALRAGFRKLKLSAFQYPGPASETRAIGPDDEESRIAWLLPQIRAMDRSHITIALGGRSEGVAMLLLHLAGARRNALLPLPILGGASSLAFERHRHELAEEWGSNFVDLESPSRIEHIVNQLESVLSGPSHRLPGASGPRKLKIFISYPRARPAEADFVEALLRRQAKLDVKIIRDETEFDAGLEISAQLREQIFAADVFIGIWCKEYACSPWCNDELETALERKAAGLHVWMVCVDDTRMVPRGARGVLHLTSARSRDEIEAKILAQLSRLLGSAGP